MSFIINPEELGVYKESRIGIKNTVTKKFEDLIELSEGQVYEVESKYLERGILNFIFKIQTRVRGNVWKDKVNYFYLLDLTKFWTNKVSYTDEQIEELVSFYFGDSKRGNYRHVKNAFNKAVKHIELSNYNNLVNLKQYFRIVKNYKFEIPIFWQNINVYLEHLMQLKLKVTELKLSNKTYLNLIDFIDQNDNSFEIYVKNEIDILKNYKLHFANFLAGKLYSFLGDREKAEHLFKEYLKFDSIYLDEFTMSKGISTYYELKGIPNLDIPEPNFINRKDVKKQNYSVVISVDVNFLRKFGPQIFYYIIILKNSHFHFHIIGDNDNDKNIIEDAIKMFNDIKTFYNTDINIVEPTYSFETVPKFVKHKPTYYACSRFIHAEYFISKFNNDIIILDSDYTFTGDLTSFYDKIGNIDVGMSIRNPMSCFSPWTRNMAGSVFLRNNEQSKNYMKFVKEYIYSGLQLEDSWILDQNALTYGMEMVREKSPNIRIENIPYEIKPFMQTDIRYYAEELLPKHNK